ncbi:tyrosine-type recombinase/integrase [Intestinibacillus massiliensis]|uniref:tyrosine-type recombinase/integrase n=1 Tax=Intestinibacillus massiliensis TaxID=1871029 RepID=UPI0013566375|nr:site-specific integrase [Intestinibacillus massiliensis]
MKKNAKGLYTTSITYAGKRYYIRAKTQKELWQRAAQKQRDLEEGKITANGNTTVERWAAEWLETYKKGSVRKGTYERHASYVRRHLVAHMGDVKMKDVRPVHLQKILNGLGNLSIDTVTKVSDTFNAIFERARRNGIIYSNPAADLELPHAVPRGSRRAVTDEERKYILILSKTHPAGLWVKMMLYCGLRPEETIPLQWCHIDLDSDRPRVRIECAVEARTGEIKPPKSEAGIRSVPIPLPFAAELRAARPADNPFSYVFTRSNGQRHSVNTLRRLWVSFKTDLDILMGAQTVQLEQKKRSTAKYKTVIIKSVVAPDLVPYCMRHTYCTDLQAAGVPINVAKELMGHSDIKTTSAIYTHSTDVAINHAADMINAHAGATSGATPNTVKTG